MNKKELSYVKKYLKFTKKQTLAFDINWNYYYDIYRQKLLKITKNKKMIVNCLVVLCYERHPRSKKKILWSVAGDWIANNIKQVNDRVLTRDIDGDINILGENYKWVEVQAGVE